MIELYPEIRLTHITAVIASGALFAVRGFAINVGAQWAMVAPLRYLSYAIDSILLAAAITLTTIVHQYPFVHAWLTVKVLLLVVYIVLGSFAVKRAQSGTTRWSCYLAALAVYVFIITVARAHHPLGVFAS